LARGFTQTASQTFLPINQRMLQRQTEALRQGHDLLSKVAHQATAAEFVLSHTLLGILDEVSYALERWVRLVEQQEIQFPGKAACIAVQYRLSKGFFTIEVVIERALGNIDPLQHAVDTCRRKALLAQHFHPAPKQIGRASCRESV